MGQQNAENPIRKFFEAAGRALHSAATVEDVANAVEHAIEVVRDDISKATKKR